MLYTIRRGPAVQVGVPEVTLFGRFVFGEADTTGHQVDLEPDGAAVLIADGWLVEPAESLPETQNSEPEPPAAPPAPRRGGSKR